MSPFYLEDTTASSSAADDAAFEVGTLLPTNMDVGHTMDLQEDVKELRLFPEPLDGSDEAGLLALIFGTPYSAPNRYLPWLIGDQDAIFGRMDTADIEDAEWQLRRPPRTTRNGLGDP